MVVKELIEELNKLPQDFKVKTWDAYNDCETEEVIVSIDNETKEVFICNTDFSWR